MADQGLWFKLWLGFDEDPDLGNLSDKDLLSWILLGCYLKKHGNEGMTCLMKPALALQRKMRLDNYETLIETLKKLPNVVCDEKQKDATPGLVALTVEWKNWHKYQDDYSTVRSRMWRDRQRFKKRREEKRGEEKRITPFSPPTILEVRDFAIQEKLPLDCEKFFNHYQAKGWLVGKAKMRDWRAAARGAARDWACSSAAKSTQPSWM